MKKDIEEIKNLLRIIVEKQTGYIKYKYTLDPDIIIIGGKISNSWKFFNKSTNKAIKERYFSKPCNILKSNLKEAGILGAAALVLEK